jgi:hypothetical protein
MDQSKRKAHIFFSSITNTNNGLSKFQPSDETWLSAELRPVLAKKRTLRKRKGKSG